MSIEDTKRPALHTVRVRVNGQAHSIEVEPRLTLADFLREKLALTGTHVGCEHGVCGACTVLVNGQTARSCLMLAVEAKFDITIPEEAIIPENFFSIESIVALVVELTEQ